MLRCIQDKKCSIKIWDLGEEVYQSVKLASQFISSYESSDEPSVKDQVNSVKF
ncbi:hypothetical protein [Virgibacillus ndiopensis]|uniref:hypothetical protein n=1 Tax=Virgibacillus ndiopensis TaxID=2004408 RepID=UPI00159BA2B9|nr:hypothetical protein [Virgibacillus ndiopensis]